MAPEDGRVRRFVRSKEWQKVGAVTGSFFPSGKALGLRSGSGGAEIISFLKIYTCKTPSVVTSRLNYIHIAQRSKTGMSHLLSQERLSQTPPGAHTSTQSSFVPDSHHSYSPHPLPPPQLPPDRAVLSPIARPRQPHALCALELCPPQRNTSTTLPQNP